MRRTVQLDSALVKKLMQRSELLCHQDDDHDATARANISFQAKPCMHFGVCVCQTPKHQDTLHFWTNLARIFRQIFWKKKKEKKCSEARQLLDDYAIFLEFSALTEETALVQQPAMDVKDDWDALVLEEFSTCNLDINDDPPGPSSYHFHIAYMNFKTYHFGLWQLQHCQQDDLHDTGDTDINLLSWVRPGFEFEEQQQDILTDLEAIAKLNFKQQWKVSIQTFALGSHLFDVDCASLAVTPVSSVNEFVVWKGSEEESKRRRVVANQSRSKNKTTQDRRGRGKRKASKKQGNGPKRRKTRQQNDDPELALLDELVDEHRRDSGSDSDPQVVVAADDDNYDCDNADPYGAEEEESKTMLVKIMRKSSCRKSWKMVFLYHRSIQSKKVILTLIWKRQKISYLNRNMKQSSNNNSKRIRKMFLQLQWSPWRPWRIIGGAHNQEGRHQLDQC